MEKMKHLRLMKQVKKLNAPKKPKGYGDSPDLTGTLLIDDDVRYITHLKVHRKNKDQFLRHGTLSRLLKRLVQMNL